MAAVGITKEALEEARGVAKDAISICRQLSEEVDEFYWFLKDRRDRRQDIDKLTLKLCGQHLINRYGEIDHYRSVLTDQIINHVNESIPDSFSPIKAIHEEFPSAFSLAVACLQSCIQLAPDWLVTDNGRFLRWVILDEYLLPDIEELEVAVVRLHRSLPLFRSSKRLPYFETTDRIDLEFDQAIPRCIPMPCVVAKDISETGVEEPMSSPASDPNDAESQILTTLQPAIRQAYYSYRLAEEIGGPGLKDETAHGFLKDADFNCDEMSAELAAYKLPALDTWTRYLRRARKALDAQKKQPRSGRAHGKSIIRPDEK